MRRQKQAPRSRELVIEYVPTTALIPNPRNARRHPIKQISKLARIINEYGWSTPMVIDEANRVLAGNGRLEAAKSLDLTQVPCVRLSHLDESKKVALGIADNAMSDASSFDDAVLRSLLVELTNVDFDMELTGLDAAQIDFHLDGPAGASAVDAADQVAAPAPDAIATSRVGDIWQADSHRLLCGDARTTSSYERLLDADRADIVFTDPPFNVPINGHVSGLGRTKHREFAMASGEMTELQFSQFLTEVMSQLARFSTDGSIHYHCIDWRHVSTMFTAAVGVYTEVKNLCVWNKTNAGMGSLYRSKHELIVVFKSGTASHCNNVELGRNGRYRTNVWDYPGANAFGGNRKGDLAAHPTVKPIELVADAIRDCFERGALVLDPFMGSGTTILAAERCGRRAAGIEIDPLYVDVAIRRWQKMTGNKATLAGDGRTFDEITQARQSAEPAHSDLEEGGQ